MFRRNNRWVERIIILYLSPVGTTGAFSKTQLMLNKEIKYKSATPMKLKKEKMLGPKKKK